MEAIIAIVVFAVATVWAVSSNRKERAMKWDSNFNRDKIEKNIKNKKK